MDTWKKHKMQKIIYTGKFFCELCKKEIATPVYGDSAPEPQEESEWVDMCRHFHWIDIHRVCAICGKIIQSGDLELAFNDGKIKIHSEYTDEYKKIEPGVKTGNLLIVHEGCVK